MSEIRIPETDTQHSITRDLLTKSRSVDIPEALHPKRGEFEAIYEKLPVIAQKLLTVYKKILAAYKLDPGEVRLYMVGGRVKGKPIKDDSDIDLIFSVANRNQSPGATFLEGYGPMESQHYKLIIMQDIMNKLKVICEEQGVANHFHIIGYGSSHPEQDVDATQTLLLGTL